MRNDSLKSAIYRGTVRHRRLQPMEHRFSYRLFMMYLDLAEIDRILPNSWFWNIKGPALIRYRRSDYLGDPSLPLDEAVRQALEKETGRRPAGPIRMLTHLRYFGFCFNPVTFYYCFSEDETRVESLVAEVTNTPWRERHAYVLFENLCAGEQGVSCYIKKKGLHVSPFMEMNQQYEFRFQRPGAVISAHMNVRQDELLYFKSDLNLSRIALTRSSLMKTVARFPAMTVRVLGAIYWQALRLRMKGAQFYVHPKKSGR